MSRPARGLGADLLATTIVAAFSVTAALGLIRVFDGGAALADTVVIVVAGHGASLVLRRSGAAAWLVVPILLVLLGLVLTWRFHPDTTGVFFLPTGETWSAFVADARELRGAFPEESAPVPYEAAWPVLAGLGVALVVLFADTFAFAADARSETLVPGGMFFVFVSALGDGDGGVLLAGLVVAVGVATVAVLRARHDPEPAVVLPQRRRGLAAWPTTVAVAGSVALVAVAVGPLLPGANEPPLIDTTGRSGGVTEVVSPLVDIRSRLVELSDAEAFRVRASEEAYWRVTTLPEFDGTTFRLPTRPLERADGALTSAPMRPGAVSIRQEIEVVGLGGRLVPAAADPVEASGRDLRWNPDTSTLVTVSGDLVAGERFTVVSSSPRVQPAQLRDAGGSLPTDPIHLALPPDFPGSVSDLALQVTAGAPTAYDTALALQDWFRSEFDYSLEVQPGHDSSAIEDFLDRRVGYCEQFSATFAAMARSLGLPSRVAVGYTAGNRLPDGSFSVLGRHAHAWPEVWFGDLGWVPFEPTPGRGVPGTEQYTGVAPDQDATEPEPADDDGDEPPVEAPDAGVPTDPLLPDFLDPSAGAGTPPQGPAGAEGREIPWRFVLIVALVAAVVAAPSLVRRTRRARAALAPPADRIQSAWQRATESARRGGVPGTAAMTASEWARATGGVLPVAARPMASLAAAVDLVTFAPPGAVDFEHRGTFGSDMAQDCVTWAHQVEASVRDQLHGSRRIVDHFTRWR